MPSTTPNPPTGPRKRIQPWPSDNLILSTNQQSMHAGRQTFSTAVRRDGQITSSHDVSSKGRRDIIIDHYNENQNTSHYSCYIQGHWPWPSGQLWPSGQYYQHRNKTPKQPIKTPTTHVSRHQDCNKEITNLTFSYINKSYQWARCTGSQAYQHCKIIPAFKRRERSLASAPRAIRHKSFPSHISDPPQDRTTT